MSESKDIKSYSDPRNRDMDRNRGLQWETFSDALERAAESQKPREDGDTPEKSN